MSDDYSDDLQLETEEDFGDLGAAQARLKRMREELSQIKKERQEYLDGWQRCKADSVNARKDAEARDARGAEILREALVHDIIPALDSFDMAVNSEVWTDVSDGWRSGMEHVREQLIEALRGHGIERYGKIGEMFDASLHESVQDVDDAPGEPNSIVQILRYGYRSKTRVLRPAQIVLKSSSNKS